MEILKKTPATMEEKSPQEDRMVMLSDGVFAIAMTLLILDVRLPSDLQHATFQDALGLLLPKFISYVISFIMISTYWGVHRQQDDINYFLLRALISPVIFLLSLLIILLPVSPNYVYFSWWMIYVVFLLLRRFRLRLFPKLAEFSEQSAEPVLADPISARES